MCVSNRESPSSADQPPRDTTSALRLWLPVIGTFALLAAYSLKPGGQAPTVDLSFRDKIDHFSVYGLLGLLTLKALPPHLVSTRRWLCAFAIVSTFGAFDELLQHFNPARTGDPLDWLADSLGALLAVVAYTALPWFKAVVDWKPHHLFSPKKRPAAKVSLQADGV